QDQSQARALTAATGTGYITLLFNDGPGGGIGGEANELDFRNLRHRGQGSVSVGELLGGPGQPGATSDNIVGLTVTVAAHEIGHMAGLLHPDALGWIGAGLFSETNAVSYLPSYTGPANATETPHHVMASPNSLGTTLFDAAGPTYLGEREAIKLAF